MLKNGERPLSAEEQAFFRGLYQRHYPALFDHAVQLGIRREAAEDYVQETFLAAIRHIETIRNMENPRWYLNQILKNVIGYRLRSLRYAVSLQQKLQNELGPGPEEGQKQELRLDTLYGGAIRDTELELLIRFYLEGWSQRELAEAYGISQEACKKRIKRAKQRLRRALEEDESPGKGGPSDPGGGPAEGRH